MKGIRRIDRPHTATQRAFHGWEAASGWRGYRARMKFGDASHGGSPAALRSATLWLRDCNQDLGKPNTPRMVRAPGYRRIAKASP